mmetsp:Transcript_24404/g.26225  ORF Transcript_24404/g.26225 Transcript_24404/m.26225 type:complete len:351 (-) Transcript_24404:364-1416(-)
MPIENDDHIDNSNTSSREIRASALIFLLIIFSGLSALILGCIQNFNCKTITFPQNNVSGSFDSGPFSYRFSGVQLDVLTNITTQEEEDIYTIWKICRSYRENRDLNSSDYIENQSINASSWLSSSVDNDPIILTVQAMAISAVILGSLLILGVCNVPYCGLACILQWKCYGFLFIITGILQGVSLLILNSTICLDNPYLRSLDEVANNANNIQIHELLDTFDDKCKIGVGFKCGIASTILWFITSVLICLKRPPGKYEEDCLTQYLQMSSEAATARRIELAAAASLSSLPLPTSNTNNRNKIVNIPSTRTKQSPSAVVEVVEQEHGDDDDNESSSFHSANEFVDDNKIEI